MENCNIILIDDNLEDLQCDHQYFIQNQQNTTIFIKELTDHIFNETFKIIDHSKFQAILPAFISNHLLSKIDYYNQQYQINKNEQEKIIEQKFCNPPEVPLRDNGQSFCIQGIDRDELFIAENKQLESFSEDQFLNIDNNTNIDQENKQYDIVALKILEKTDEQFYQELRQQKVQRDGFLKNQIQELEEQRKQKRMANYNSQFISDLKDKKYTYGYDGNIIMINRKEQKNQGSNINIKVQSETQCSTIDLNKVKITKLDSFNNIKKQDTVIQTEQIQTQKFHDKQYDLFQPQKGVIFQLENGQKKQGIDFHQQTIDEINELELTVNDQIRMTKKEYKNLTIIKNTNIYDKSNESSHMDILNDLLKNELNTNKPNTQIKQLTQSNSLQILDKIQYDLFIQQEKNDKITKIFPNIDETKIYLSQIDKFNQDIMMNQKHLSINNTSRQSNQMPIQRFIIHQNKKANKTIPINYVKYPREAHKQDSMALLMNQQPFLSHRNQLKSTSENERYSFSLISKNIINN